MSKKVRNVFSMMLRRKSRTKSRYADDKAVADFTRVALESESPKRKKTRHPPK